MSETGNPAPALGFVISGEGGIDRRSQFPSWEVVLDLGAPDCERLDLDQVREALSLRVCGAFGR